MYFNKSKYTKWYFKIIDQAKTQNRSKKTDYYEAHHIIPKSFEKNNDTVLLTAREHYICHLLLTKMCIKRFHRRKMTFALHKLIHGNGKNYCNSSKIYEKIRRDHHYACVERSNAYWSGISAEQRSMMRSGKNNSRYGAVVLEETKAKISAANKGRFAGDKHHLWNKGHTEESKKKMSVQRKGKCLGDKNHRFGKPGAALGKKWFNNGVVEQYNTACPAGWSQGRLKRGKKIDVNSNIA